MTDEQLVSEIGDIWRKLNDACSALDRVKSALDLPFHPSAFAPLFKLRDETTQMVGAISRIIAERDRAHAALGAADE